MINKKKITPCNEAAYIEFPELLFGITDQGMAYFDPASYIKSKGLANTHSTEEFLLKFDLWMRSVSYEYTIPHAELVVEDMESGLLMIEGTLALIFIAYTDSGFMIHIIERMEDMMRRGIALSDSFLLDMARERFGIGIDMINKTNLENGK